jgi:hypothetical protein
MMNYRASMTLSLRSEKTFKTYRSSSLTYRLFLKEKNHQVPWPDFRIKSTRLRRGSTIILDLITREFGSPKLRRGQNDLSMN